MTAFTNNVQRGLNPGLPEVINGSGFVPVGINGEVVLIGAPTSTNVTSLNSGLAYDSVGATLYQQIGGDGGSAWIKLGSTT